MKIKRETFEKYTNKVDKLDIVDSKLLGDCNCTNPHKSSFHNFSSTRKKGLKSK